MTKRHHPGWPAPALLSVIAGISCCFLEWQGRADEVRPAIRAIPPPPPAISRTEGAQSGLVHDHPEHQVELPSPELDETPIDAAELASVRTALNPLLVRDRRHRVLLLRGADSLERGDSSAALAQFQALFDAPQDAFFWSSSATQPFGARQNVVRRFAKLTRKDRETYERLYGATACVLLDRYRESHDRRWLFELFRRFSHADAAREAAVTELLLARDAGFASQAAEWAQVLIEDSHHWQNLEADLQRIVAASVSYSEPTWAQRSSGSNHTDRERSADLTETTPPFPVSLWSTQFDSFDSASHSSRSPDRNDAIVSDIRASVNDWLSERIESRLPIASANEATVSKHTLMVRDFEGVQAYDLLTGRELWTYKCGSSLIAHAARKAEQTNKSNSTGVDYGLLFSGNPVFGRLATDGNHVLVLDKVPERPQAGAKVSTVDETPISSPPTDFRPNQLVALPIRKPSTAADSPEKPESLHPVWSRGTASTLTEDPLSGHLFMGSPLCVDDRVFVLSEHDGKIHLWALDAATGSTLWMQGVALINELSSADSLRGRTACSPVYSSGVVACPTEVGVVIGVDALTGRLLWAYDHMDEDQRSSSGRWTFSNSQKSDRQPLSSHTTVSGGRLLYLPRRSDFVHCVDLATGRKVWTRAKRGSVAIGGANQSLLLLLGERHCRALRIEDGHELWQTITPEPAGIGLMTGRSYLLPTSEGPCLSVNLVNGEIEGRRFGRLLTDMAGDQQARHQIGALDGSSSGSTGPPTEAILQTMRRNPCGNLIAAGNLIVATTPLGISVFPQAQPALDRLQSARPDLSMADRLTEAQLLLTLGDHEAAGRVLDALLSALPDEALQGPAEQLLREILYAQLDGASDYRDHLQRIDRLSRTDEHRLRRALRAIEIASVQRDADLLIDAVLQFQSLPPFELVNIEDNGEFYQVCPQQYVWERLSQLQQDESSPLHAALLGLVTRQAMLLESEHDIRKVEQFVKLFAGWEPVDSTRLHLARSWIHSDRQQEAELLLLSDRFHEEARGRGRIGALLASLHGEEEPVSSDDSLTHHSERPPENPRSAIANPDVEFSLLGTALVAVNQQARTSLLHRTAFSPETVSPSVEIHEHICSDACAGGDRCACLRTRDLHNSTRRRFVPNRAGNLIVLDRNPSGPDRSESRLLIADRDQGIVRGEITVPVAYWQTPSPLTGETGHLMVIGGETAFGVSLLEGKLLWSAQPQRAGKKAEKFKIGPVGSDFCVLQTPREVRVVDPATGRLLWRRTGLAPGCGLEAHDSTGIIGDSRTMTVFDADQSAFTVYHTQSGRLQHRSVRTSVSESGRRQRWGVGRRLVELIANATGSRLVVWDSRDNRVEFDIPLLNRLCCPLPGETEFAYVTSDGDLQVLNVNDANLIVDLPLSQAIADADAWSAASMADRMTAFSDPHRFYVNLVAEDDRAESKVAAAEEQLAFPSIRVRGQLLAIDRRSQSIVWQRRIHDAAVPLREDQTLPILVLARQRRDDSTHKARSGNEPIQRLIVEILDAVTGETLAEHDHLLLAQFVDCAVNRQGGSDNESAQTKLSLLGLQSCIDITYRPAPHTPVRTASQGTDVRTDDAAVTR